MQRLERVQKMLSALPPPPVQPKHLPSIDDSLATEILPAPPPMSYLFPSSNSHHKRPPTVLSYLPVADPGSTYVNTMSMSLSDGGVLTAAPDADGSRKKKRARTEKSLQPKQPVRASARNPTPLNGASTSSKVAVEAKEGNNASSTRASRHHSPAEKSAMPSATTDPSTSRRSARKVKLTVSAPLSASPNDPKPAASHESTFSSLMDSQSQLPISNERSSHVFPSNDLALASESAPAGPPRIRVHMSDDVATPRDAQADYTQAHAHQQSDICASCVATTYHHPSMINMPVSAADRDFGGGMLYCDSCPRGFHFLCLDPPIDALSGKEDIPTGGWFCQECSAEYDYLKAGRRISPPLQPGTELFGPLLSNLEVKNPAEFQLPEELRTYYKNVVTGPRGGYIDGRKWRLTKGNKQLLSEDRDLYRLRDRYDHPVLCFKCCGSAVRTAVSGDPYMAALVPPSPTIIHVDHPSDSSRSSATSNLDILSQIAAPLPDLPTIQDSLEDETAPLEGAKNTPPPHREDEIIILSDSPPSNSRKRKREASPSPQSPSGENNSQTGPRTRRRTENYAASLIAPPQLEEGGRAIISCDYCPLHFHMDCLDPPMTVVPVRERKWMCPNHIDHIFATKPRIPKNAPPAADVSHPGQNPSALIDIITAKPPAPPTPAPPRKKKNGLKVGKIEDIWVGSKRYRVPETFVILDFWKKVRAPGASSSQGTEEAENSMEIDNPVESGSSSLTELSSSDNSKKKPAPDEPEQRTSKAGPKRTVKGINGKAKKSVAAVTSGPSRLLPRRGVTRKPETVVAPKASGRAPRSKTAPPSAKPATVNSYGGLTLRIPKPNGSPSSPSKPTKLLESVNSSPSKQRGSPTRQAPLPNDSSPEIIASLLGASSPTRKRAKKTKAAAPPARRGLRSDLGKELDPSPHTTDTTTLPPTDSDSTGTSQPPNHVLANGGSPSAVDPLVLKFDTPATDTELPINGITDLQ